MSILNNIVNAKVGSTQVQKIILNSTIIWENNDNSDYIFTAEYNDSTMYLASINFLEPYIFTAEYNDSTMYLASLIFLEPYIYTASYSNEDFMNLSSSQDIIV